MSKTKPANSLRPGEPGEEIQENRKRRRELVTVLLLGLLFLILTWVEFRLTAVSQKLPFIHSIFFFGLVNLNIALLLFLLFLIFRNVVKIFVERKNKVIGSSLKGKLVAAFVAFSFVPTVLMFLISVFYINSSFDKWFSVKMAGVLKDSLEVTNAYYMAAKKRNYHFAHQVSRSLVREGGNIQSILKKNLELYKLDAIEYYPGLFANRVLVLSKDEAIPEVPKVNLEFLQKGLNQKVEASSIHTFGEGNLVRVVVPVEWADGRTGAVVVSSFVPLSLISKMNDIADAYEDFRDLNPLEYPIKSIYLSILILMTLVILFAATWFGFHLAKQLSTPLQMLGLATQRVSQGDYKPVAISSGSQEISQLVTNFNHMTKNLETTEREAREANLTLKATLERLDEHSRYIEVVLSQISTGVISADRQGNITTINRHAARLLKIEAHRFVGRPLDDLLTADQRRIFEEALGILKERRAQSLKKELRLSVRGEPMVMQMTLSVLRDEKRNELGVVLVFDDLTMLVNAQRAAAWREVARRIAHEIKNPLTPIKLSAQRLEKKFGTDIQDPAFSTCISTIIKQVDELKNLVNEFSNFARLPQAKPVINSLNRVIEEALVLYQTGHKDIQFVFNPDPSLPEFEFDPEQIKRVLSNLLDNSVAALSGTPGSQPPSIAITTHYDNVLNIVRTEVGDNGIGIPEADRGRIFEPYFSTKEEGTGLGLAIVKRIIEDHSGFVRAYANEPRGTKIVFELPVTKSQLVAGAVEGAAFEPANKS
ncbi:MAG TPA: ATP-binding protein [Bdellovibrionales bacterium]|nr:ATP-binding protein [Bdellovibrionales bacterium]